MNKTNWRLKMLEEIDKHPDTHPRLLLHVCCAPCSSGCLEELCAHFDVTCFYFNPNISPREEFDRRACELERLTREMPLGLPPRVEIGSYEPERFEEIARGLEDVPEGGERCFACYRLRLEETARHAKEGGYDYFTTTLSISPLKNADKLNLIGGELAETYGAPYLFSDFKKADGYLRSIPRSKEYHLYRQDWCGCIYSKKESERRRAEKEHAQA
jgi:predicted adenine nucleotide alpha hydrolase (AANH) superfamily ATPase